MNCDEIQGYLFSEALPAAEIEHLLCAPAQQVPERHTRPEGEPRLAALPRTQARFTGQAPILNPNLSNAAGPPQYGILHES